MERSEQINELATALSKAQAEIKGAIKNKKNPYFKSDYADLQSVIDASKKPLTDNGLSVIQSPASVEDGRVALETMLLHASGQFISSRFTMPVAKANDPQSLGSSITYARRYARAAIVDMAQEDDDGNAANNLKSVPAQENANRPNGFCSNEKFTENIDKWRSIVESGKKTSEELIATVSTKATLTDKQKAEIASWSVQK